MFLCVSPCEGYLPPGYYFLSFSRDPARVGVGVSASDQHAKLAVEQDPIVYRRKLGKVETHPYREGLGWATLELGSLAFWYGFQAATCSSPCRLPRPE
jgi:hypothetical protein